MTNPQKENGYTAIANEILEQLVKRSLLGAELSIILFVIRKTYGFHKKSDAISLTQFEKGTGLSRPTICKTLKNLYGMHILVKNPLISFNKHYDEWLTSKGGLTSKAVFTKTSKHRLTETSKAVLTHKRKKEIKERKLLIEETRTPEKQKHIEASLDSIKDIMIKKGVKGFRV